MATDTQITETAAETVQFYSRGRNERLVRRPLVRELTSVGTQRITQEGVRYEFAPEGRLTVKVGQDVLLDGPQVYDEQTNELRPKPQDAVSWLRNHPLFNVRFWEEGREPDRPLPTEQDFLAGVTDAVAQLDPEPLEAALAQERATHNRPLLIDAAEGALRKITETRTALQREQEQRQRGDGLEE